MRPSVAAGESASVLDDGHPVVAAHAPDRRCPDVGQFPNAPSRVQVQPETEDTGALFARSSEENIYISVWFEANLPSREQGGPHPVKSMAWSKPGYSVAR